MQGASPWITARVLEAVDGTFLMTPLSIDPNGPHDYVHHGFKTEPNPLTAELLAARKSTRLDSNGMCCDMMLSLCV